MKIEFIPDISEDNPTPYVLKLFFDDICGIKTTNLVDRFIITEDRNYISVVSQIDSKTTVSNNESVIGIAKTIFNDKTRKSTIIIKNHQIIPVIHGINSGNKIDFWTFDQLDALYTSLHEFGHAKDNFIRISEKVEPLVRPFMLENVSNYYHDVIVSEIGANICAQKIIPQAFKDIGRDNLKSHIRMAHDELVVLLKTLNSNINENTSFKIIGNISIIIIKIQEVFIHRSERDEELISYFNNNINYNLLEWIKNLEKSYPNWIDTKISFQKLIINILNSIGLIWQVENGTEKIKEMHIIKKNMSRLMDWLRF